MLLTFPVLPSSISSSSFRAFLPPTPDCFTCHGRTPQCNNGWRLPSIRLFASLTRATSWANVTDQSSSRTSIFARDKKTHQPSRTTAHLCHLNHITITNQTKACSTPAADLHLGDHSPHYQMLRPHSAQTARLASLAIAPKLQAAPPLVAAIFSTLDHP